MIEQWILNKIDPRKAISAGRLPVEFIGRESTMELKLLDGWFKKL